MGRRFREVGIVVRASRPDRKAGNHRGAGVREESKPLRLAANLGRKSLAGGLVGYTMNAHNQTVGDCLQQLPSSQQPVASLLARDLRNRLRKANVDASKASINNIIETAVIPESGRPFTGAARETLA